MTTDKSAATVEYSWSTDGETYQDRCASIEEAISEALNSGREFEVGQTLFIGQVIPVNAIRLADAGSVIDDMQVRAYDLCGEPAEDYLACATKEQCAQLESLIAAWADSVEAPNFWDIGTVVERVITIEDLDETCEAGQPECGPVTNHDSEGVPLCAVCWDGLLADSQDGDAAEVKS